MLRIGKRVWRSHPVLVAAMIGSIIGAANAIVLETRGLLHGSATGVLPLLFPSSVSGGRISQMTTLQVALLLLIEIAGNVLGFAMLCAAPVAAIVVVRRLLRRSNEPLSGSDNS